MRTTMATENNNKTLNVPNLRFPEFSGEWEKYRLKDIANISKERIGINMLSNNNYISTENMKSDFGGVDVAINLPASGNVIKFQKGDTLLSNIRPYLKKIWQAKFDGGCSADIFVFRSNILCNSDFLYYTLANEKFISYAMSGAKGVKMPRGDKEQILKYELHLPTTIEQNKITSFLSLLDERIATQIKIIEDLKKLKSAISKQIFVQKPICWNRLDTLFSKGKAGGTPTSTNKDYYNGDIPFLSINDITKQGKYIRYTENHLSQSGLDNSSAWIVPAHSLIMSMYASVGLVTINEVPIATSQAMFVMQLKDKGLLDYLYYYLSYFKNRHIHKYIETGTQSNINADIVRGIMIPYYGHEHNIEIASTLRSIDAKIDNESAILGQLNKQKNYLLSQMFI